MGELMWTELNESKRIWWEECAEDETKMGEEKSAKKGPKGTKF